MYSCEICNDMGRGLTLCGGCNTVLCLKHDREWVEYGSNHPQFLEHIAHSNTLQAMTILVQGGYSSIGQEDLLEAKAKVDSSESAMYDVGKAWLMGKIEEKREET